MREIVWSDAALDDVEALVQYIAQDNPNAAAKVLDRIEGTIESLAQMPAGRRGRVSGTYEKPVSSLPYIIAYALQPMPSSAERLVILRVIHGARRWPEGEWPE